MDQINGWDGVFGTSGDWWGKLARVLNDGVMEVGKYIDFHNTDTDATDYTFRITNAGTALSFSGDLYGQRLFGSGSTNAFPALGYANASTSLILGYGGDYSYGLLAGVLGSGDSWIQVSRFDGTATAYGLQLQPLGGSTFIGNHAGQVYIYGDGSTTANFVAESATSGYCRLLYNGGAALGSYWYTDTTAHGLLGSDGSWDLQITRSNNFVTLNGSASIPSGQGYFFDGGSSNYISNNGTSTYTCLYIGGSKGNYSGFYAAHSGVAMMWDSSGNGGPYREANSRWYHYYVLGNDCTAFGGTDTSASYRIYVTGSSYATGSWATSDARKKENVRKIPSALDRVCAMRGVEFTWRPDANVGQDPSKVHLGVIAQELNAVVPEVVNYAEDVDTYAVDYNGLVGLLIEAVKELKEKYEQTH